jgi:hypothetical protein
VQVEQVPTAVFEHGVDAPVAERPGLGHEHHPVSSKPSIDGGTASSGATIRRRASRSIAVHTLDQDTPNRRAIDAGVASIAVT